MATNFEKARDFMRAFGQNVQSRASLQDKKTAELRYELIREELEELRAAIDSQDLLEIADALTDILYVTSRSCMGY
jgi:predicted HAD superfamily Cof-like phosphohydrolase